MTASIPSRSAVSTSPAEWVSIPIGRDQGIDHESVVTFDNIAVVPKALLTLRLGELGPTGRDLICAALRALADC
ncbi:MAG TPA: hypothetical protein VM287_01855 [Egibacteraceae bacterium]|jgi:mRNA-degrading endonuclease toxin of MazEF toxin-antitoxin module|nr:hypothetical protein [Egibacteraceae bacterium]